MEICEYFNLTERLSDEICREILKIGLADKCMDWALSLQLPNEREFAIFSVGRAFGQWEVKEGRV
jgi:hypothetical protein